MNIRPASEILRGTSLVAALTLVSRIFGFIRDMLVASLFGAGQFADAFFVAFRIPNLLRSFVAEGALTSAFVPVFSGEVVKGKQAAQAALSAVLSALLVCTAFLSIGGIVFARQIVLLFAPGFVENPSKLELCVLLTQIMMPYILFVSLVALLNGALNAYRVYGISALAQVIMNVCLIAGAFVASLYVAEEAAVVLAISVLVGGIVQVVAQLPALARAGLKLLPSTHILSPATAQVAKLMLPALIGATIYQFSIFLNTVLASLLVEGSVSWLYYADRVTQLPIGIFTISLASVLLPSLSRASSSGNQVEFSNSLSNAIGFTGFIILPVAAILCALADPIVGVLFERGAFDSYAREQTAMALQAYCVGLWAVSAHSMLTRAFIAKKDTLTSTLVGVLSLITTFVCSLMFIGPLETKVGVLGSAISGLQAALPEGMKSLNLGHVGLALATSVGSFVSFFVLAGRLSGRIGAFNWGKVWVSTLRSFIPAVLAGLVAHQTFSVSNNQLISLALSSAAAVCVYLIGALALKSFEAQETFRLFARLIKRRR
jgi:putative peptidoglycan lipid II flippase